MRVVIQRVLEASVSISGTVTAAIGPGLLVLLGIGYEDGAEDIDWLVKKIAALRIFDDADGVMNVDVRDAGGDVLVVSQFTLLASTKKGNRPAYIRAARPEVAIPLYERFCAALSEALGKPVPTGTFGADMQVAHDDGAGKLLGDFPAQGILPAFAGFHLPAGKLPPVFPGPVAPLGGKDAALLDDEGRDDFDPFQGITVR